MGSISLNMRRLILPLVLFGLILNGWCEEDSGEIDQIISGYRVPNNRMYPYMVYFTTKNRLRQDQFLCSGTLVAPRKVLTAASCFEWIGPNSFPMGIFTPVAWMNTEIIGGPYTIRRTVTQVNKHPQYNPANGGNHDNIAVITLDTEVLFSSVNPVKLGYTAYPKIGEPSLITVGWGYQGNVFSNYLLHGRLRLIQDSLCKAVYGNVDNVNTICASFENVGACGPDVGGPVLFNGEQIGVIGKNMRCGGSEPIVAVDVRIMASFIRQYV